jgi:5-methylcytosine-specific restriction endonuclease McrA
VKRTRLRPVSKKTRTVRWPALKALRAHVLARSTMAPVGHCEYAGGVDHWGPLDVHHVIRRSAGGTDEPSNLLRLCRRHHDATDRAFAVGRLVITRLGGQRFRFQEVWALSKWEARG